MLSTRSALRLITLASFLPTISAFIVNIVVLSSAPFWLHLVVAFAGVLITIVQLAVIVVIRFDLGLPNEIPESAMERLSRVRIFVGDLNYSPPEYLPSSRYPSRPAQFTVYRPSAARTSHSYPLLVFAHEVDSTLRVDAEAADRLGPARSFYGNISADSRLPLNPGTDVTVKPWIETAQFEPEGVIIRWRGPVQRAEFRFTIPSESAGKTLPGMVQVFCGLLLICEVAFTIDASTEAPVVDTNPISTTASCYQKIFASYAHADRAIVDQIVDSVQTLGHRYLRDVLSLRAGEIWSKALEDMIDQADIFQLFWSSTSMRSPFVKAEWEYALGLAREKFVRPVYWEQPMPVDDNLGLPPDDLKSIHFAQLQLQRPGIFESSFSGRRTSIDLGSTTLGRRFANSHSLFLFRWLESQGFTEMLVRLYRNERLISYVAAGVVIAATGLWLLFS